MIIQVKVEELINKLTDKKTAISDNYKTDLIKYQADKAKYQNTLRTAINKALDNPDTKTYTSYGNAISVALGEKASSALPKAPKEPNQIANDIKNIDSMIAKLKMSTDETIKVKDNDNYFQYI